MHWPSAPRSRLSRPPSHVTDCALTAGWPAESRAASCSPATAASPVQPSCMRSTLTSTAPRQATVVDDPSKHICRRPCAARKEACHPISPGSAAFSQRTASWRPKSDDTAAGSAAAASSAAAMSPAGSSRSSDGRPTLRSFMPCERGCCWRSARCRTCSAMHLSCRSEQARDGQRAGTGGRKRGTLLQRAHRAEICLRAVVCSCQADAVRTAAVQCGSTTWLRCLIGIKLTCTAMATRAIGAFRDNIAIETAAPAICAMRNTSWPSRCYLKADDRHPPIAGQCEPQR